MKRYKELKYNGKKYYKEYEINDILVDNKLNWFLDAEIKNVRFEIENKTLIWNAGIWYNGVWEYGVFRSGQWSSGTWKNGVWYNGLWKTGTFENGIIYGGEFISGDILKGKITGGNFHEVNILDNVKIEMKEMNKIEERNGPELLNDNPMITDDEKRVQDVLNTINKQDPGFNFDNSKIDYINNNTNYKEVTIQYPSNDDLKTFK